MPSEAKDKSKDKVKAKEPKKEKAPAAEKAAKADKPEKAAKAEKAPKGEKGKDAVASEKPAKVEPPRAPADPRVKVFKKFQGRFLPKGPLRDRWKALETRWNSGDDRGGVTADELKSLLADWRASRAKPVKKASV
jgi:hypothetical protein